MSNEQTAMEMYGAAIDELNNAKADLREALDVLEGLYARLNRPDDATDARAILTKHGRAV